MAETMKDYEAELEASFKKIEEGDILTGTVVSVDDKEIIVDLKYYAEGIIPVEDYSREPGFNVKEEVHPGDEVSATVVKKDDGNGNILLSKVEATDVLAWDRLKELKDTKEVTMRLADRIEENIRSLPEKEYFRIDQCVTKLEIENKVTVYGDISYTFPAYFGYQ